MPDFIAFALAQGWSEWTMITVLLDYINDQKSAAGLKEYCIQRVASENNEETD